jgi:hypothetical protein
MPRQLQITMVEEVEEQQTLEPTLEMQLVGLELHPQ